MRAPRRAHALSWRRWARSAHVGQQRLGHALRAHRLHESACARRGALMHGLDGEALGGIVYRLEQQQRGRQRVQRGVGGEGEALGAEREHVLRRQRVARPRVLLHAPHHLRHRLSPHDRSPLGVRADMH